MSLLIGLILIAAGCEKKEPEIRSAAESMAKNKKVNIITDGRNAPFVFGSGTGVQGLDVDLGNEIAKDLNIEANWVKVEDIERSQPGYVGPKGYEHMFQLLADGSAEMIISAVAIDPKRTDKFAFSKSYFEGGDVIAHQRSVFDIKDLSSISGKKIGVVTDRPADVFMTSNASGAVLTKFPTVDDALGALNRTELNAVAGDQVIVAYSIVNSFGNTTLLPNLINKYQYAVVVRKEETDLLDKINATIDRLQNSGELQKMKDKWQVVEIVDQAIKRGEADKAEDERRKAPKTIAVTIQKLSGDWSMDRLDGFQLVLAGSTGSYQSNHIETEGNRGRCSFTRPVPPGKYRLQMPISRVPTEIDVPDLAKTSLAMQMNISGSRISIQFK